MNTAHKEADSPSALAYRMAGYIADAAYIARYVEREYGRAFPVAKVKAMQEDHKRQKFEFERPKAETRARTRPDNDNGEPFRVTGLVKLKRNAPAIAKPVRLAPLAVPYRPRASNILAQVAHAFGLTVEQLKGATRARYCVIARAVAIRILRNCERNGEPVYSLPKIAHLVGRHDHNAISNSLDKFPIYMEQYPDAREIYDALKGLAD